MGGQSSQQQQQQQTSSGTTSQTQNPWAAAQPLLGGILGQAGMLAGNTGANPYQQQAITGLANQAMAGNPWLPQMAANTTALLGGGGATAQIPTLQNAYTAYQGQLSPFTSPGYLDPNSNPYLAPALATQQSDITNAINSEFAAAGGSGSPQQAQALARGLSQGLAGPLLSQYNTNVGTALGAGGAGFGAANTTAQGITGLTQQQLANQAQGFNQATNYLTAAAQPYQNLFNAGTLQQQIPQQNLGFLAQLGVPIAGLGGTTTATSTGQQTGNINATYNPSVVQQAQGWANVFGNLFPSGVTSKAFF
jgi:hypothetical protein